MREEDENNLMLWGIVILLALLFRIYVMGEPVNWFSFLNPQTGGIFNGYK